MSRCDEGPWLRILACVASLGIVVPGMALAASRSAPAASDRNVILILIDDQGYGNVGVNGNRVIRTPNIDRLASESVRLTDLHVVPTCSPTRAALLTGRYSTRTGV
jgi:hypothetical protein